MFNLAGVLAAALMCAGLSWITNPGDCDGGGSVYLTVTIEQDDLLFVMSEDADETAQFEVVATLEDVAYNRVTGSVNPGDLPRSVELELTDVPPGRHDLAVVIVDRETGRSRTLQREVFVPGASRACWTSDDLLIQSGYRLRPSDPLMLRWAVFPPSEGETSGDLRSAYVVRDDGGEVVAEGWMMPAGENQGPSRSFEVEIDLRGSDPGQYQVIAAAILDEDPVAAVRADIEVLPDWDVWGADFETTRLNIRPIALSSELGRLENAGSRSQREAVMSRFWKRRDPTPDTSRNEYLDQYLSRLDYVERRFSVFSIRGAATDMGRVYLLLGEPDIIEDHPMEVDVKPYQIWTYFTPALTVVFIDETGYGSFELTTPWEEIRDSVELPASGLYLEGGYQWSER